MKTLKKIVGERIKVRRKEVGYATQAQLAEAIGTDQATVGRWEAGIHVPNEEHLQKLYRVLNINEEDLLGFSEKDPHPPLEDLLKVIGRQEQEIDNLKEQLSLLPADILMRLHEVTEVDWQSFRALKGWPEAHKLKKSAT